MSGFFNVEEEVQNPAESKSKAFNGDGEKKKQKMYTPVTLQLFKTAEICENDLFKIDGQEVNDVVLVGRIYKWEEQPTRTTFFINDNTGVVKVAYYNKEENSLPKYMKNFVYEEGCYAKVFGSIKNFKGVNQVVGVHLAKIEDFDIITNHFLQVFIGSCVRKKGILSSQDLTESLEGKKELNEDDKMELIKITTKKIVAENQDNGVKEVSKETIFRAIKDRVTFPEFERVIKKLVEDMELFEDDNGAIGTF